MEEINLKNNKDSSIIYIFNEIIGIFGEDYFDSYIENSAKYLIDFWEDDLFAFGLKRGNKSVYISTWDFRSYDKDKMVYNYELEIINPDTLETIETVKEVGQSSQNNLLISLFKFFK